MTHAEQMKEIILSEEGLALSKRDDAKLAELERLINPTTIERKRDHK